MTLLRIDIIYESVGGEMYDICINNLAIKGRLIIIGFISGYQDQSGFKQSNSGDKQKSRITLEAKLLAKSASVRGFFLPHYQRLWKTYTQKLISLLQEGKIQSVIDISQNFQGLEQIPDAIDYMYQGKNVGKLLVKITSDPKVVPKSKL